VNQSKIFLFVILTLAFISSSCDIYTTALGETFARDDSYLSSFSANEILGSDANSDDKLEALSTKTDEELTSLSTEDKETILDITLGESIAMDEIGTLIDEIYSIDSEDDIDTEALLDSVIDIINPIDTTAALVLLNDPDTLETADATSLLNASVALIAQAASELISTDIDIISNLEDSSLDINTSTTDEIIEAMMGEDVSDTIKQNLTTAINTLKVLTGNEVTIDGETVDRDITEDNASLVGSPYTLNDLLEGLGL
jgi:hypothetical protein